MVRKIIGIFSAFVIFIICLSCEKVDEKELKPVTNVEDYFKTEYGIEPINESISLEKAKKCYVSLNIDIVKQPQPKQSAEYFKYNHKLISTGTQFDCYAFDIKDCENVKFYMYIKKDCCSNESYTKLEPCLYQTLFVYERLEDLNISFAIGDKIEVLKEKIPEIQILNSPFLMDADFFEILDETGINTFFVNENGIIVDKKKIVF